MLTGVPQKKSIIKLTRIRPNLEYLGENSCFFLFSTKSVSAFCFALFVFLSVLRRHLISVRISFFLRFTRSANIAISCSWVKPKIELDSQAEILSKISSSCSKSTDVVTINLIWIRIGNMQWFWTNFDIISNLIFLIFYRILHSAELTRKDPILLVFFVQK